MTIRTWNSDQQLGSRNQERLRLRDWLELRIGKSRYPGLVWEDKTEMTFRIPWKHGARHGWREKEDARLFRDWSEHTGRFYISLKAADVELLQIRGTRDNGMLSGASPKDVKQHKANFRCALNSLRDVRAVPQLSKSKGDDAYRVYKMLPKQKTKSLRMWIRKRGQRHVGNIRRRYQSPKTQRQKAELTTDELLHSSGGTTDIPQFTTTPSDTIRNICGKSHFPQLSSSDNFMDATIIRHTTPPANSCSGIYQQSYFPHSDETGMQIFPQRCYPHSNECPIPQNPDETVSESIQVASAIMDGSHYPTPSTFGVSPFGAEPSYEGYQSSGDCFELCKSNDLQEIGPYPSSEGEASENGKECYDVDLNWEISIAADESYCSRDNGNRFLPLLQSTCNPSYLLETSDGSTSYDTRYSAPKPVQSISTETQFSPSGKPSANQ
uniref:uncharacterized protein LOC113474866 n=1 Tax=Ciona intestinalis TaxID=7719 RepID=UPI000EF47812|nr:uncharacterized protein LOC113474866 [Ciona intestinalis]|eukprot:XP_026693430.1 uncharacterized protein LOC113474866 [Ciona intestinalis]